jgi:hypothetical protein
MKCKKEKTGAWYVPGADLNITLCLGTWKLWCLARTRHPNAALARRGDAAPPGLRQVGTGQDT